MSHKVTRVNNWLQCPKCSKTSFSAELEHIDGHELRADKTYMHMICQHCDNQLMFVVDLMPVFDLDRGLEPVKL